MIIYGSAKWLYSIHRLMFDLAAKTMDLISETASDNQRQDIGHDSIDFLISLVYRDIQKLQLFL